MFCSIYRQELVHDILNDSDWQHIQEIVNGLQPFHEVTLSLEGRAPGGYAGAIWEALPAIAVLLQKMENGLAAVGGEAAARRGGARNRLAVAYQNAWEKLQKYYKLTDDAHSIYGAAVPPPPYLSQTLFRLPMDGE